ncbi:hypothetical protein PFISCL1PPCAC_7935, partial [Pristionchus fissidentatus]
MYEALVVFDICQTIFVIVSLLTTIPVAAYVYFKLLFTKPYAENYTFKLIVVNGVSNILSCTTYLIIYQMTSFPIFYSFYKLLQEENLVNVLAGINSFLGGIGLNSALAVALNRIEQIVFMGRIRNDLAFFVTSLLLSIFFALPSLIDHLTLTTLNYFSFEYANRTWYIPRTARTDLTLQTTTSVIRTVVSLATLLANLGLAIYIFLKRKAVERNRKQGFNAEKGLIISGAVSYIFYMLYFMNSAVARYLDVMFCGYAQFLFLGLTALTPFWIIFNITSTVSKMSQKFNSQELLDAFDLFNTIFISTSLVITLPLAVFVYFKLLFCLPYSKNYTFKLIVFNGLTVTNFFRFHASILRIHNRQKFGKLDKLVDNEYCKAKQIDLSGTFDYFFNGVGFHTAFFVAMNRLRTILFFERRGVSSNVIL